MRALRNRRTPVRQMHSFFGGGMDKRCRKCGKSYLHYRYPEDCPGSGGPSGHVRVGDSREAGSVARPVFVVLRPPGGPDAVPSEEARRLGPAAGRSPVANSPFNGGWRWWLLLACCVMAVTLGFVTINIGIGLST